jgi:hypothetical protein
MWMVKRFFDIADFATAGALGVSLRLSWRVIFGFLMMTIQDI